MWLKEKWDKIKGWVILRQVRTRIILGAAGAAGASLVTLGSVHVGGAWFAEEMIGLHAQSEPVTAAGISDPPTAKACPVALKQIVSAQIWPLVLSEGRFNARVRSED